MENINTINTSLLGDKKKSSKHPRFSDIHPPEVKSSLLTSLIPSGNSSPVSTDISYDADWAKLCAETQEAQELMKEEFSDYNKVIRSITFESPEKKKNSQAQRLSIGTINRQREELRLAENVAEIEDEMDYYVACIDEIRQNFVSLFIDIQKRRLHTICARRNIPPPNAAQIFAAVEALNLDNMNPIDWAPSIETALFKLIA